MKRSSNGQPASCWLSIGFALAKRYEVVSSCVVVSHVRNGKEIGFERLDGVWTRHENPADFNAYIAGVLFVFAGLYYTLTHIYGVSFS